VIDIISQFNDMPTPVRDDSHAFRIRCDRIQIGSMRYTLKCNSHTNSCSRFGYNGHQALMIAFTLTGILYVVRWLYTRNEMQYRLHISGRDVLDLQPDFNTGYE